MGKVFIKLEVKRSVIFYFFSFTRTIVYEHIKATNCILETIKK